VEVKINSESNIKGYSRLHANGNRFLFFIGSFLQLFFFTTLKNVMAVDVARMYSNASAVVAWVLALFFTSDI
jgi:hypothetical protein